MAHRKLKSSRKNLPGGALQLKLRQYSERPSGPICIPWEALYVNLIGPYTLKGKDGSSIDFMALTMIDPASSWLEVMGLPTITRVMTKKVNGKERTIEEEIFDKSSDRVARLFTKSGCVDTRDVAI